MKSSKRILYYVLLFLAALIFVLSGYKSRMFGAASIDELLFYTANGLYGANTSTFYGAILENSHAFIFIFGVLVALFIDFYKNKKLITISIKLKGQIKKIEINPSKIIQHYYMVYAVILFITSILFAAGTLHIFRYISSITSKPGTIFEEHYVDPKKVQLTFPSEKRNLIYIYLESMENTILSSDSGGVLQNSLIPELEQIVLDGDNISFSNTNKIGGMLPVQGTNFTVGAISAQSSGLPLLKLSSFDRNAFGNFRKFLPGAYSIGEVLEKQGYNQEFIIGSEASFGGRDKLFTQHGNYKIFDYNTAKELKKIDPNYHVWWGYEDKKLFEYAKEELTDIASKPEPFNFQLLTVDTHFVDGYLDETCATNYEKKYMNVYACSSKQVGAFVEWIKQQDFYKNTTVVIAGDHVGMQDSFYKEMAGEDYQRTVYNVILNSVNKPINNKNRLFTSFDLYPTTLASMGVKIDGDKLGLGVNLYSNQKTLVEQYSLDWLESELHKKSNFYYNDILIGR